MYDSAQLNADMDRDSQRRDAAAALLSPEAVQAIRAWHNSPGRDCVAESEGQTCCVDTLLAATR